MAQKVLTLKGIWHMVTFRNLRLSSPLNRSATIMLRFAYVLSDSATNRRKSDILVDGSL